MCWKPLVLVLPLLGAAPLLAADVPVQRSTQRDSAGALETARAATDGAVASLYRQIAQQPITAQLTVGQLLASMELIDAFKSEVLQQQRDQIGAPRWIDEYTCQVQLEIPSARVGRELMRYAASHPRTSPVTAEQVDLAVNRWPRRVFSATGSSASAVALDRFKPVTGARWAAVSVIARQKALAEANTDATNRAMDSVRPVLLSNQKTVGDGFAVPEVRDAVRSWLSHRPVMRVDFRDDLQVEVALAIDRRDFFNVVRTALTRQRTITLSKDLEWTRIERDFSIKFAAPAGLARVTDEKAAKAMATAPAPAAQLPVPPRILPVATPEWVALVLEAEGSAAASGPKLKTSLTAEANARAKLQMRIETLALDRGQSVGDAAQIDRRVTEAVARAVKQARISKIDYRPDGTVIVHVNSNLRDFWNDLRRQNRAAEVIARP